jgi:phosphatidylserine/phosphatidylglycerophosphate/cardiolipin synthase-like enzyme
MSDTTPVQPISPPDSAIEPPLPITPPAADGGIAGIEGAAPAPGKTLRNKQAVPWFLKEVKTSDPMTSRSAAREISAATPLVDGKAIFSELENLIDTAKSTVLLAYWGMDLSTKMVSDSDRTWMNLLVDAAARKVRVRVLVSDFDPGLEPLKHLSAWFGFAQLLQAGSKASVSPDSLQAVVARHPAEAPWEMMKLGRPDLYDSLATEISAMKNGDLRQVRYLYAPGLWDKITFDKSLKAIPVTTHEAYPSWPASHHQKVAIIDGRYALTGGVNIAAPYIDTDQHDKPANDKRFGPWHDTCVRVEGPEILRDFTSNYIGLWNQCRAGMDAFLATQAAALKKTLNVKLKVPTPPWYVNAGRAKDMKESDVPIDLTTPKTAAPIIPAQIRRTVAAPDRSPPYFKTVRADIVEGYLLAIGRAERFVYLENQYLRDERIPKALIDRHRKNSNLRSIIVIPSRSEEEGDPVTQYGNALQYENVAAMQSAIGAHVGVFMLERASRGGDAAFTDSSAKTAIVYVHSKLFLVDDTFASIGSANANPRSLAMDTELDFVWYDAKSVTALRLRLWKEVLGNPSGLASWKATDYVRRWSAIADANQRVSAKKMKGFVRHFENKKHERGLFPLGAYS